MFIAYNPSFNFSVSSQAASGTSAISAGTYRGVTVDAIGNWTMRIG